MYVKFAEANKEGDEMRGYPITLALAVLLVPGFAQDVVVESDSDDGILMIVENTGGDTKTGIKVLNTVDYSTGIEAWGSTTAISANIDNTGETFYTTGVASSVYDDDAWSPRAFSGYATGGDYSSPAGLYVQAGGGNYSYPIGVYAEAWGGYGSYPIAGYFNGELHYGSIHEISDQRFKRNIRDFPNGIATVMALRPRLYEMKTDEYKGRLNLPQGEQIGFVAQEVEGVLPQLVSNTAAPARLTKEEQANKVKKAPTEYKALDYVGMIPVLVKAIQEQQARIEALEARLK